MITMRGAPVAACLDEASLSGFGRKRMQFSVSRSKQQNVSSSCFPSPAATFLRSGIKAKMGLVSATGLRSERQGLCGFGLTSTVLPGFHVGSILYRRDSSGVGSSSRRSRIKIVVAQGGKNGIQAPERILAALGYILPFFDGIQYGRYFFLQYPVAENLLRPLYPLLAAYKGFPYSNFIAFFSLYLLVVRNQSISRYVRFNAMQAVVLDVLLILPTLVERTFAPRGGVGFELLIIFYNTVFLFLVACFLFGVVSCIFGQTPRLPIVADAADAQV